jgi:carbonic anhydrase
MATYTELYALGSSGNTDLRNKIAVANHILAVGILKEAEGTASHAQRVKWASAVLTSPDTWAEHMMRAVVADNAAQTPAAISGASDATILTSCTAMVNAMSAVL